MIEFIEEWRKVPGYEEHYEVSNTGRVRSFDRMKYNGQQWHIYHGKILKLGLDMKGYYFANLYKNQEVRPHRVHRLVLAAFAAPSDQFINHIDGIKTNNRVDNLEYCTAKENGAHASMMGLIPMGERSHLAKLQELDVKEIIRLRNTATRRQLARRFGVCRQTIDHIMTGRTWKHIQR